MSDDRFDFGELKVYQKSLDYVDFVYEITEKFPKKKILSLANQYRRDSGNRGLRDLCLVEAMTLN